MNYQFNQDELVAFNSGELTGRGLVKGVALTAQPVIGNLYMIEIVESNTSFPNVTYPFTTVAIAECFLEKC